MVAEVLSVEGVWKGFSRGGQWMEVLKDVSFAVRRGEVVAIVGGRLGGKTTLLEIAAGIENPDRGSVSATSSRSTPTSWSSSSPKLTPPRSPKHSAPYSSAHCGDRGEPLAGWDYVRAEEEVRGLRSTHAELLERTGHARLVTGKAHGAPQAARQGLGLDTYNEGLWWLAMQAEGRFGLRDSITQRYQQLRSLLNDQLGLEPDVQPARYTTSCSDNGRSTPACKAP
jgi:energy-coupling factor transporter ATP-binding protein EcfA2